MNAECYPLNSIPIPWLDQLHDDWDQLNIWLNCFGSPMNLLHSHPFRENIARLNDLIGDHCRDFEIHYAMKANRCPEFASIAATEGIGLDVASPHELSLAIECGVPGDKITVTGIVKSAELIASAIEQEAIIIVDCEDELDQIISVAKEAEKNPEIGFRVSGFEHDGNFLRSRFGMPASSVPRAAARLSDALPGCVPGGLHFHLSGYCPETRRSALTTMLKLADEMAAAGMPLKFIDIGGGFPVNYLRSQREWEEFGRHAQSVPNSKLQREENYPYLAHRSDEDFFNTLLDGMGVVFEKRNLKLRCEPGRWLLARSGATIARVSTVKTMNQYDSAVTCDINGTQLRPSRGDFLVDPVLVKNPRTPNQPPGEFRNYQFFGRYCSENDRLFQRAIPLDLPPESGDIVIFPNTAGYHMHFLETQGHGYPLAENLFVDATGQKSSRETLNLVEQLQA